MAAGELEDNVCAALAECITQRYGLHFPPDRWSELRRGIAAAAQDLGYADAHRCAAELLHAGIGPREHDVLTAHLTVGETYFFRDRALFAALDQEVLPSLVRARRAERRLRVWSAGCCTGEETYSLAILVQRMLGAGHDWDLDVLGTDLNPHFLEKARTAIYGEWSFRDVPETVRKENFTRTAHGRYALDPRFRALVRFEQLNLANPGLGLPAPGSIDLLVCRNVLMYFHPARAAAVLARLCVVLGADGWLVLNPGDAVAPSETGLAVWDAGGTRFLRRAPARPARPVIAQPLASHATGEGDDKMLRCVPPRSVSVPLSDPPKLRAEVRDLAGAGRLAEALARCEEWLGQYKLDGAAHYHFALVLIELGRPAEARLALRRTLFLDPEFTLAHVVLGRLAQGEDETREARRHFANALASLQCRKDDAVVPEGEGLAVAPLRAALRMLTAQGGAR